MDMSVHGFPTVASLDARRGMSRLGGAVNIVTTKAEDGPYGFTASAVCSVSDTPAMLLACLNRASSCFPAFEEARYFRANTLSPSREVCRTCSAARRRWLSASPAGKRGKGAAEYPSSPMRWFISSAS